MKSDDDAEESHWSARVMSLAAASCCCCLIIIAAATAILATDGDTHRLALSNHERTTESLLRHVRILHKRQAGTSTRDVASNSGGAGNSDAAAASTSAGQASSSADASGAEGSDGATVEAPLTSFKCDFGSADAPDMCKFRVLQSSNPLSKSLSTWTLGSGRLALYQGGPLMDASEQRVNDTAGGYIFYETSNPYASSAAQQAGVQQHHNLTGHYAPNKHHANGYDSGDYASVMVSRGFNQQHESFRMLSSARVAVVSSSPSANDMQNGQNQILSLSEPALMSPNLTASVPGGMCLSFQYALAGLSADELRVHVFDQKTERLRPLWSATESNSGNWTRAEILYSATNTHSLVFSASGGGSLANSAPASVAAVASASASAGVVKDAQQRKFRGYVAIDELDVARHDPSGSETGACRGHCNFDGDLCGWTQAENGASDNGDDFDWTFGRGSDNLFTGPQRDFISSTNNEQLTGSYLYTDSGFPRRPGDRAVLISPVFQPTPMNEAMCMRIAVHMFGSGVGSLAIKLRFLEAGEQPVVSPDGGTSQNAASASAQQQPGAQAQPGAAPAQPRASTSASGGEGAQPDLVIWEMSGDAGNNWHQAQTSVSSSRGPFQVVIEGIIGENQLGQIAIDEVSFASGPCPTSPPVASKNYGDCTFEQSMCYWRNPDADIHLDDLDWIRSVDEQSIHGPNFDHTTKRRYGSFLKLENTLREPKSGMRAFLLSPIFQPRVNRADSAALQPGAVQCLSFYYYMFMRSISSSGPNLGTIRVYLASNNELVPIWRLTNPISSPSWKHARASLSTAIVDGQPTAPSKLFQIAFEGIWGDAQSGAIAIDDITIFEGACDIMPPEAHSVPGECTFDVDMCSWTNKTIESSAMSPSMSSSSSSSGDVRPADFSTDSNKSPFLQSVANNPPGTAGSASARSLNVAGAYGSSGGFRGAMSRVVSSWQLATIDARPVNLQDHTYKAPIGYTYVDVLDNNPMRVAFVLQSSEVTVQAGTQVLQCVSFWFAAFGRQDSNQLQVYVTQASASSSDSATASGANSANSNGAAASNSPPTAAATGGNKPAGSEAGAPDAENEAAGAWRDMNGKLLWSASLRNVSEANRRKWIYGQATLKADSNHIVRFVATSTDGGFALDDISFYTGACETRPAHAKVQQPDDQSDAPADSAAGQKPPATV